jgi:ElaB/YqjD/DUF883 family membrane-anchored ribosome-binding protein
MTDITRGDASPERGGLSERSEAVASTARDQASTVADSAQTHMSDVKDDAVTQAKAVVEDAKLQANRIMDDSRRELSHQAEQQTARLASSVRDVSQQLDKMAHGGEAPQGVVADLATQAAQATARFAETLEQRRPEELLDEVRRFARQRPGAFLLGAAGVGLLAGRLLRSVDTKDVAESAKAGARGDGAMPGSGQHFAPREPALTGASSAGSSLPRGTEWPS